MKKVYLFLADGFEEIEGLTVVDLLRRAGIDIQTVSIKEETAIRGGHEILVQADLPWSKADFSQADMLVLPGGGVGTQNLENCQALLSLVKEFVEEGKDVAAICAAPRIFGSLGLLKGRKATSYPSEMGKLTGADCVETSVAEDGNIITSRGLGTAIDFSLALIARLDSLEKAEEIAKSVIYSR